MGPRWFVNLMRVLAFIIIGVIIAFTILEAAGLMGLGHMNEYASNLGKESINQTTPVFPKRLWTPKASNLYSQESAAFEDPTRQTEAFKTQLPHLLAGDSEGASILKSNIG